MTSAVLLRDRCVCYYDAHSGRFMQEDPHPGKLRKPISLNSVYTYANNNSLSYKDPDGKLPFLVVAIIIGATIGGLDAAKNGGNIFEGMILGGISGLAIGGGMLAGGALLGPGSMLITQMLVNGFLAGLFNAAALSLAKGSPKDFNKDFMSGFIGGALGTALKSPTGAAEGTEKGTEVEEIADDDLGEEMTMESVKKLKQKMKFDLGL